MISNFQLFQVWGRYRHQYLIVNTCAIHYDKQLKQTNTNTIICLRMFYRTNKLTITPRNYADRQNNQVLLEYKEMVLRQQLSVGQME